jgi:anti-sigma factor RsiW
MIDHLSMTVLNGLVDGELSPDQLAGATEHLTDCPACTSQALFQTLLKSATARAGHRYAPPPLLEERLTKLISEAPALERQSARTPVPRPARRYISLGWAAAAAILIFSVSILLVQRTNQRAQIASVVEAALVTEVSDQHIATLAADLPPQVLSTDRHTVKPWFQGKLPFSFNLPEGLPQDTALEGANLSYLHGHPVAQLLYGIGKHRVSVFVIQNSGSIGPRELRAEHSGFHVIALSTDDLRIVAVSDVDPARLANLVSTITDAQSGAHKASK